MKTERNLKRFCKKCEKAMHKLGKKCSCRESSNKYCLSILFANDGYNESMEKIKKLRKACNRYSL